MPIIRPSDDLGNGYDEISALCDFNDEPVFITKDGKGDLAVLSIAAYERLLGRFELYGLLREGMDDIGMDNTRPFSEALSDTRAKRMR